jgi:hypothetical protein
MLDARNHKGKFGEDYVRVLASAAGLAVYQDDIDHDGIDLGIRLPNPRQSWSKAIEVQVKTTAAARWQGPNLVFNGLDENQFNRLAGPLFTVPRYLFVVTVPRDAGSYADLFTSGMLLRHIGYFLSLHDRPPFARPQRDSRVRVEVPVANVLTVSTLRALVERDPAEPW